MYNTPNFLINKDIDMSNFSNIFRNAFKKEGSLLAALSAIGIGYLASYEVKDIYNKNIAETKRLKELSKLQDECIKHLQEDLNTCYKEKLCIENDMKMLNSFTIDPSYNNGFVDRLIRKQDQEREQKVERE